VERIRHLIVGAGVSGLAFADALGTQDYLILEAEPEIGGYCRTVKRDGFVWDYSGHFFHFRDPKIERYLTDRMRGRVLRVSRESRIWFRDRLIDYPFQRNIRQLPRADYEECVRGLDERRYPRDGSMKEMFYARYGRGIADKFLIPYNEKLYATNLARLDAGAMGRFFPHATKEQMLRGADSRGQGYNATFTYPEGGAIQYVEALARGVRPARISLGERLHKVDVRRRVATTNRRQIVYERLISSAPLISLLEMCDIPYDRDVFSHNKVLVFNLGFDRKGVEGLHWIYFPQREICFYRVGFYDNIFDSDRMSLYVEVGLPATASVDEDARGATKARVLGDLQACGVLRDQSLVASHEVVLNPAYVHITTSSDAETATKRAFLADHDIFSIGRYGAWTYCSIEDNIVEARALAERLE
jgi:protoporphyrinogen oxidase